MTEVKRLSRLLYFWTSKATTVTLTCKNPNIKEQADLKEEIRKAGAEIDLSDSDSDDGLFTKKPSEVKIENE